MTHRPTVTTTRPLHEVLKETVTYGDQESISHALIIPKQHVSDWFAEDRRRRNPLEAVAILIETLRRNGNANADAPFLELCRRLSFVAYHETAVVGDSDFGACLREVGEFVQARAVAEADGVIKPAERRQVAREAHEAAEKLIAYAHQQEQLASEEERHPQSIRRVR